MLKVVRGDFVFSLWLDIWFLIYYFSPRRGAAAAAAPNPFIGLFAGLIENILFAIYIFIYSSRRVFETFLIVIFFEKVLPLFLIWRDKINPARDIKALCLLFLIYLVWLYINGFTVFTIYETISKHVVSGENKTPFFMFIYWLRGGGGGGGAKI